jgi:heptosyltransferase III
MPPVTLPPAPRILVVSLRRLGDLLLTTPLVRSLRRAWPDATIDVLTFAGSALILSGNPDINDCITVPDRSSLRQTFAQLTRLWKRYALAVSTQGGDRPTLYAAAAGRVRVGLTQWDENGLLRALKRQMLHRSTPQVADIHRVEQMLRITDAIGIPRVPEVVCPAAAAALPLRIGTRYAVIHAAPMFTYKQWTREGWRALAAALVERGLEVVATAGPDEEERRYLDDVWQGIVAVNHFRWSEAVTLLSGASLYVGPDTSVTHLAAATGCPTVALFGPMDPRVWGPWPVGGLQEPYAAAGTIQRRGNVWLVQNPLPCLPCTLEGCDRHVLSRSRCLDELTVQQVLTAADQALAPRPAAA